MTHNKVARAKMDQVVNDWPEACWLCVKYNLVIEGMVARGCTIPVMTISGSKTLSQRRYSGEPVFRKYIPTASLDCPSPWLTLPPRGMPMNRYSLPAVSGAIISFRFWLRLGIGTRCWPAVRSHD